MHLNKPFHNNFTPQKKSCITHIKFLHQFQFYFSLPYNLNSPTIAAINRTIKKSLSKHCVGSNRLFVFILNNRQTQRLALLSNDFSLHVSLSCMIYVARNLCWLSSFFQCHEWETFKCIDGVLWWVVK